MPRKAYSDPRIGQLRSVFLILMLVGAGGFSFYAFFRRPIPDGNGNGNGNGNGHGWSYQYSTIGSYLPYATQHCHQGSWKYNNKYYVSMTNGMSIYVQVVDVDSLAPIGSPVYVGEAVNGDEHARRGDICVTPSGKVHVFSSYYAYGVGHWVADASTMSFTSAPPPSTFRASYQPSYTMCFAKENNDVFILFRGPDALYISVISPSNTWTTFRTIWTWTGGLQSACYYFGAEYVNGVLHVVGTGPRVGGVYEVRDGCFYGRTSDTGYTWQNSNGVSITSPQKIYNGLLSRCSLCVAGGKPWVACTDYAENVRGEQFLLYLSGASWVKSMIPNRTDTGTWMYSSGITIGNNPIRLTGDTVHVFLAVKDTIDFDIVVPGTTDNENVVHFWSSPPYTTWEYKEMTTGYNSMRQVETEMYGNSIDVLGYGGGHGAFFCRVSQIP